MKTTERTTPTPPPARPSEEADAKQLEMARQEGEAYGRSLRYMIEEVAEHGGKEQAGQFVIGWAQEEAEGMYHLRDGRLEWMEPAEGENCHLEIAVTDAADGRFVPYLTVRAELESEDGTTIGPFEVPFVWHPGLYHYGVNLTVPKDGSYTLRVHVDAPTFMRHDEVNGERYAEPVDVEFTDVKIETGRE